VTEEPVTEEPVTEEPVKEPVTGYVFPLFWKRGLVNCVIFVRRAHAAGVDR
jgi:hypothetical protein